MTYFSLVSSFSKLTGDYSVLSSPDMGILALTYSLEVKENGTWRLRETPGKVSINYEISLSCLLTCLMF